MPNSKENAVVKKFDRQERKGVRKGRKDMETEMPEVLYSSFWFHKYLYIN